MRMKMALLAVLGCVSSWPGMGVAKDIYVGQFSVAASSSSSTSLQSLRKVGLYPVHLRKYNSWKDQKSLSAWQKKKIEEWGAKLAQLEVSGPTASDTIFANLDLALTSGEIAGGDRVILGSGSHGTLLLKDFNPTQTVTFKAASGAQAQIENIMVIRSSNVTVSGLQVWPTLEDSGNAAVIRTDQSTRNVTFEKLDVRSAPDADNYMAWTLADWERNKRHGALMFGQNVVLRDSHFRGLYANIVQNAVDGVVENNHVEGFSGDGMRPLADGVIMRGNLVENCIKLNNNHDDGIQSFARDEDGKTNSGKGKLHDVVIENNRIYEWSSKTANPLRCRLQGISLFDGMYYNFTIQNNVVNISAYHGITMLGGENSVIRHNTVTSAENRVDRSPWIRVGNHKKGMPSKNVVIANNIANRIVNTSDPFYKIVVEGNYEVTSYLNDFADAAGLDYRLKAASPAVDGGTVSWAATVDMENSARPMGKGPDAGAYEVR